ncbi:hypothetical protein BV375_17470 [Nostoc sp. 106C]|nr:hypothetical protein BV375_17470 [Nostoc sp. 106C]
MVNFFISFSRGLLTIKTVNLLEPLLQCLIVITFIVRKLQNMFLPIPLLEKQTQVLTRAKKKGDSVIIKQNE